MVERSPEGRYDVTVDDKLYSFEKWGAEESLTNLLKIAKMVGKPLGMAVGGVIDKVNPGQKLTDMDLSPDLIGLVFEALTDRMDEGAIVALVKKLSSDRVLCEGAKITFNSHYEDKLGHLFKVVKAALDVQYGNFFDALLGSLGASKAQTKSVTNRELTT